MKNILKILELKHIDPHHTIIAPNTNAGVTILSIEEVLEYIYHKEQDQEKRYLEVMIERDMITLEILESFIKHFLFDNLKAVDFMLWKKNR